ncbi:MAG TPA: ABC transporter permease [Puia sp.]|nr:ABC transporter permease [Puia sp.]
MFKNHLKTAWRNLARNPKISIINIGGLAIGLTCALVLYLYASSEFGFDTFYKDANNIYRVYTHISLNGAESNSSKSSPPVAYALRTDIPEVEASTVVGYEASYNMKYEEKVFREHSVYTADSNYFKVFDHPLLKGNAATALTKPNTVVITETTAKRYFGNADAVGKQFIVNDSLLFMVSAVMTDFPANSHFNADMFLSLGSIHGRDDANWLAMGYSTFVKLKNDADTKMVEQKLKALVDKGAGPQIAKTLNMPYEQFGKSGNAFEMRLEPLTEVHLYSKERYGIDPNTEFGQNNIGNIMYVRIFIISALFVLLIAVFNFINIATARSEKKAKETGIRKTLGSARWQLMQQYFTEAFITTLIAVIAAVFIVSLVSPWLGQLFDKTVASSSLFSDYKSITLLLLFTIAVALLAGSYPAIYLSRFKPVDTLKGVQQKSKNTLRSILVVSQFAISIAFIIGMLMVKQQLNFMQNKNLGMHTQQLITIYNGASLGNNLQSFRQELIKNPAVVSVTNSSLMFASGVQESAYTLEGRSNAGPVHAAFLDVDEYFVPTFGIQLKEGRFFDLSMGTDSTAVVINETAAKAFAPGAKSMLGQRIEMASNDAVPRMYRIIGVTKDFNYESLHQQVKPLVLHLDKVRQASTYITIKYSGSNHAAIRSYIENTWDNLRPNEKCNFSSLDNIIDNMYQNEKMISALSTILSVLAIFVACLGLFGLAMFVTEQRKKEIGIRKVLGASVAEVTVTISKQFVIWIGIANLIAWPLAYMMLKQWLQNFAYHIQPAWWMFIIAGIATLLIAIATVCTQSIKAALANPVKSLRSE